MVHGLVWHPWHPLAIYSLGMPDAAAEAQDILDDAEEDDHLRKRDALALQLHKLCSYLSSFVPARIWTSRADQSSQQPEGLSHICQAGEQACSSPDGLYSQSVQRAMWMLLEVQQAG